MPNKSKMNTKNYTNLHKIKHIFAIVASSIVLGYSVFAMTQRLRYPLYALSSFLYADMILVQYCRYAFEKLPPREKSPRKSLLKLALFLLFSGNLFAIVCQAAPFYGPLTAAMFYAMATGGSVFLFYAYMIYDGDGGRENWSGDEERRAFSEVETNFFFEKV